ncbi:translocation/assembly module TamB domain-containing protein [Porphyromonas gulae]|uniref:translocation/assembly module TamB domain-containing protein n=1 Tax=Porphyromonas gulae TaxID=111105 RepID=UPI001F1A9384|nr:translocation/assembly module TamB domain-containing protein [Porphyromonas gulae]
MSQRKKLSAGLIRFIRRYRTVMRRSKWVVVAVLTVAFCLLILPNLILQIPSVRGSVAGRVQTELSKALETRVRIGHISIGWWRQAEINDIVIFDRAGRPAVSAERLTGGLDLLPLLRGRLSFSSARLFKGEFDVYRSRPDTALNIQFILDALKSKNPEEPSRLQLNINTILLRNCRLSATGLHKALSGTLGLHDLNAKVRLFEVDSTGLKAQLRHLSFLENSTALNLKELHADVSLRGDTLGVDRLHISLQNSHLRIASGYCVLSPDESGLPAISMRDLAGRIRPSDLKGGFPALDTMDDLLEVSLPELAVGSGEAVMPEISMSYGDELTLQAGIGLAEIGGKERMHVRLRLDELKLGPRAYMLAERIFPDQLPPQMRDLGAIDIMAAANGRLDDLRLKTRVETDAGALTIQGKIGLDSLWRPVHVDAHATTERLEPQLMAGRKDWPEHVAFDLKVKTRLDAGNLLSGSLAGRVSLLTYRGYTYEDLTIDAQADRDKWSGILSMNDPNGHIRLSSAGEGLPFSGGSSRFEWNLTAHKLHPDRLLPGFGIPSADALLVSSGELSGNGIDNLTGTVRIDTLDWQTADKGLHLRDVMLSTARDEGHRSVVLSSPFLHGKLSGEFDLSALPALFQRLVRTHLPALMDQKAQEKAPAEHMRLSLAMEGALPKELCSFLGLPVTEADSIRIRGDYSELLRSLDLQVRAGRLMAMNKELRGTEVNLNSSSGKAELICRSDLYHEGKPSIRDLSLQALMTDDSIRTRLDMGLDRRGAKNGFVSLLTNFRRDKDSSLNTHIRLDRSTARIGGYEWQIASAEAILAPERLVVSNLSIKSEGKAVEAEGVLSNSPSDSLRVRVDHISLKYILELAGVDFDMLDVEMTGEAVLSDIADRQFMQARITGESFTVNGIDVGPISAFGSWEKATQSILLDALVHNPDGTSTSAWGYIRPFNPHAGLDLRFDAKHADVAFIGPFLSEFCHKLEGHASGNMRLFGDFSDLTIEGEVMAEQVTLGVKALNTEYKCDGQKAVFTPTQMRFENMLVSDPDGHTARLNAHISHRAFDDIKVDLKVSEARNILAYNVPERDNPNIHGRVYVSGAAYLRDVPGGMRCDVNLISEKGTHIVLNFTQPTTAEEYRFLRFVDPKSSRERARQETSPDRPSLPLPATGGDPETDFHLVMNVGVTPDAEVDLILDPQTGDGLRGSAGGDLRIDYHTLGDLNVFGGLELLSGTYNFNLRQIVQKRFSIKEGSSVNFAGNPMHATLNLTAEYNLTANLNDLDESLVSDVRRTTIPVNCLLQINGAMLQPAVSFDIKLPNSDSELERRVRSLIHSEDSMTKQIVYLLVLGKFYTPENVYNSGSGTDNWTAVATTTLSQQLTNMLGSLSDKVQIGTSIKTTNTSFQDTDIELLLSSRLLNNRLLINGNVGYRDNPNLQNTYVGEFDAEYKINPSGSIRIKAYNHYNNLYQYLRQSLTTQGLGLIFKYDFDGRRLRTKRAGEARIGIDSLTRPDSVRAQ